jgi:preprotein translocase subunit YajC
MKGLFMRGILTAIMIGLTHAAIMAQDTAAPRPGSPGLMEMLPFLVAMFLIVYFMMIRPQQKKQKETQKMLEAIKKGDRVVTIGGLFGTVGNVKDTTVMVKVAENTVVEVKKSAISTVVNRDKTEKDGDDKGKN